MIQDVYICTDYLLPLLFSPPSILLSQASARGGDESPDANDATTAAAEPRRVGQRAKTVKWLCLLTLT